MTDSIVVLVSELDPEPRDDVAAALIAAAEAAEIPATLVGPGETAPAATVAFAFDPSSLEHAPAGAFRVAVLPAFATDWREPVADAVLVAHEEVAARLGARARRHAHVVGPIAPPGFVDEAEGEGDGDLEGAVVVLLPSAVMALGPTPLFVQLSLVGAPASFLFDVGRDVELADALRTFGAGHLGEESRVGLFSSERQQALYRRADVVVGAGYDLALAAALGAGTPVVAVEPERASEALAATGAAVLAPSGAMVSVALDEALGRHDELTEAAVRLEAAGGAARALEQALELAAGKGEPPRAEGLPAGIEWLPTERELGERLIRTAEGTAEPADDSQPPEAPDEPSLEDRIEAELEALKKKLG